MNRNDIIRIAQEAGLHIATDVKWMPIIGLKYAEKFAALVIANHPPQSYMTWQEGARAFPKPAQQAPVAWMHVMDNTEGIKANGKGLVSITQKRKHPFGKPGIDFSKSYPVTSTPLYTTPPHRKPLTDEEILSISADCASSHQHMDIHFARAIEDKLKEKNT